MTLSKLGASQTAWTQEFAFVRGEYALGGEHVPYFSIVMSVSDSRRYLTLAKELALDPDTPINIEELIQRDLNLDRAVDEIAAYLLQPNQLKFFNSLTVVLMPIDGDGRPVENFPSTEELAKEASPDFDHSSAGSVNVKLLKGEPVGYIRWQTDRVKAVIIDGQHRFRALDHVHQSNPLILRPDMTSVPVLILVLDQRMGFHPPVGGPKTILKASRSIFTDLNKHAVKVSPEREYLLDDRSLLAVCTRSVVTSGIGGGSFEKSKTWPGRIPLAIIDWNQPNRSKFGDGFFVSTIQSLHQLVSEVVNTNQPRPTEYERLEAWLDSITARFELSKSNIWKLDTIKDRLREVQQNDLPFALTTTEVEEAAQGFRESIGQIIVQCLLGMTPYSALFSAYSENGFLGGQKEFWLGQAADGRSAYVTQFGENPKADADRLSQSVKKKYRLAYQVVFQRGFILAAREIDSFRNELADLWQIENSRQKVLEQWIKIFNERIESLLDNSDFWWGTAVLFDGSINYNQVSKKAIVGAIVLATIDFPDMGVSIEKVQLSKRSITNLLSSNRGPILELIESDRFTCDAPTEHQTLMAKRWVTALASLEPGVKAHDPLVKLMKAATRMYRDGIKRHIGQLADANNVTLDDDGVEKLLRSFGARRMAFWATD